MESSARSGAPSLWVLFASFAICQRKSSQTEPMVVRGKKRLAGWAEAEVDKLSCTSAAKDELVVELVVLARAAAEEPRRPRRPAGRPGLAEAVTVEVCAGALLPPVLALLSSASAVAAILSGRLRRFMTVDSGGETDVARETL